MIQVSHCDDIEPCPFLPQVDEPMRAARMKECGKSRGDAFYLLALQCAQSLWRQGLPAQSILLMNRAFGADMKGKEHVLAEHPPPYSAMVWVMKHHRKEDFIGNPRRHFQHLATRMVEPRKELRSWRAWGCWWYACQLFPEFPADEEQLKGEGIEEPSETRIAERLALVGMVGESTEWAKARELL